MQTYEQLNKQAIKKRDYNHCTVIATATVCEMSYNRAYKKLERVGRMHRRGTWMFYEVIRRQGDRKSTRLNSSHGYISYAVFCLKKKKERKKKKKQQS